MDKTKILKNIFELAEQGMKVDIENLPHSISKDVVEKQLLYIELKNLVKRGGNAARIDEIKQILNPKEEGYVD